MPVVPGGASDPKRRLERLLAEQEPAIRTAFLLAVQDIRDAQTIDQLAALIEAGRIGDLLDAVRPASEVLAASYGAAVTEAAIDTAAFLTDTALTNRMVFDRARARVFDVIANEQQRLIRIFTSETNQVITETLQDGFTRGINPRQQARQIREAVGLTPYQERVIRNYRAQLAGGRNGAPSRSVFRRALHDKRSNRVIERAIKNAEPLSEDQIDSMVTRYRRRWVNYHAEVVARTEALSAIHQGSDLTYRQAIEDGTLTADQLVRTWVTARDERVRGSHRALNGVTAGFGEGEVWRARGGNLRFPGDPSGPLSETAQCRCIVTVRIRELDEFGASA